MTEEQEARHDGKSWPFFVVVVVVLMGLAPEFEDLWRLALRLESKGLHSLEAEYTTEGRARFHRGGTALVGLVSK